MKNKIIYSFLVIKEKISVKMKTIHIYFLLHIFSNKLDTKDVMVELENSFLRFKKSQVRSFILIL